MEGRKLHLGGRAAGDLEARRPRRHVEGEMMAGSKPAAGVKAQPIKSQALIDVRVIAH